MTEFSRSGKSRMQKLENYDRGIAQHGNAARSRSLRPPSGTTRASSPRVVERPRRSEKRERERRRRAFSHVISRDFHQEMILTTDSPSSLSKRLSLRSSSPASRAHFSLNHHGESAFCVPRVWIGKSGYQSTVICVSDSWSRLISAPPSPWLLSKPCFFSHSITSRLRPSASQQPYFSVWRYCGLFECRITRVLRFCSHLSPSRKYVFT